MAAKFSGPLDNLANPCSIKPYPTITRSGMGGQRATRGESYSFWKFFCRRLGLRTCMWRDERFGESFANWIETFSSHSGLIVHVISNWKVHLLAGGFSSCISHRTREFREGCYERFS